MLFEYSSMRFIGQVLFPPVSQFGYRIVINFAHRAKRISIYLYLYDGNVTSVLFSRIAV